MKKTQAKPQKYNRNLSIDLIKCIAVLCVIMVHFFSNTEFYSVNINNMTTNVMVMLRTTFMICVPLFMITTGFLMINKELNAKYYKGIIKTASIYILCFCFCLAYKYFFLHENITVKTAILGLLNFEVLTYSWYIEMYIGLFLIIPFLNLIYNGLKTDKQRYALVFTMLFLTTAPSFVNYFYKIIPDYWTTLYPLTYYFLGAHIRKSEKQPLKKWRYLFLFVLVILINTFINITISKNKPFVYIESNDWGGIQNVLSSLCLFIFVTRFNFEKVPKAISFCITKISEYSLGIYLSSYILDRIVYTKFNAMGYSMPEKFKYFIVVTGCVFIGSLLLSMLANFIYKAIHKLCGIIYNSLKRG